MARQPSNRAKSGSSQAANGGDTGRNLVGVMSGAQDAADALRAGAERAAERLPEAVAGAEAAARETQKALGEMPNQALVVGTSFSLGLGVGLFLTGSNRLLVLLAILPALAMAATLLGREQPGELSGATD